MVTTRTPLDVARILAAEYGHTLEPVNYVRGVAISGRLRLHQLDGGDDPAPSIVDLVDPFVTPNMLDSLRRLDGSADSAYVWADELTTATGNPRYAAFLEQIAGLYLETQANGLPAAVDADFRVEDIFFASAILGRAYRSSDDQRYAETLFAFLDRVAAQPDTGLWWHCNTSRFYWGRGNAFAALGFAEALSYLPADDPRWSALQQKHLAHLETLIQHQHHSGAWRQLIDRPDSYLEFTATAMIGIAITRGIRRGWLSTDLAPVAATAWAAVDQRINDVGLVRDACPGTGPLPTLDDYLDRTPFTGHDDRAGAMALWFALDRAALLETAEA